MMNRTSILLLAALVVFGCVRAPERPKVPSITSFEDCLAASLNGWEGIDEITAEICNDVHDLPSALDLECAEYEANGYPDEIDKAVCKSHIEMNILPEIGWTET